MDAVVAKSRTSIEPAFPDLPELTTSLRNGVVEFPVHHVRGGTSTGLVIWERLTPQDQALKEELLRHLMGLPMTGTRAGNKQITGLGRIVPTGNKVFFAEIEESGGAMRLVSTLAQLAADKAAVDWSVNCGNMSAALPVWALDTGLVQRGKTPVFEIDIRNTNTGVIAAARMQFGADSLPEEAIIPGADGSWPGVDLFLNDPVGAKTGKLLPTGKPVDRIDGIDVSCVDVAVPMVILRAADVGRDVQDKIETFDTDATLMARLRAIWVEAGLRMQLKKRNGDLMSAEELAASETVPKVCLVGAPAGKGNITARYFTPQAGHRSMAVSGGCCLAAAALVPGTVAASVAKNVAPLQSSFTEVEIGVENPAGILDATIEARIVSGAVEVAKAAYKRSTQILLRGHVPLYHASRELRDALLDQAG